MIELPNSDIVKEDILCVRLPLGWKDAINEFVRNHRQHKDTSDLIRTLIIRELDGYDPTVRQHIGELKTDVSRLICFIAEAFDINPSLNENEKFIDIFGKLKETLILIDFVLAEEIRRVQYFEENHGRPPSG